MTIWWLIFLEIDFISVKSRRTHWVTNWVTTQNWWVTGIYRVEITVYHKKQRCNCKGYCSRYLENPLLSHQIVLLALQKLVTQVLFVIQQINDLEYAGPIAQILHCRSNFRFFVLRLQNFWTAAETRIPISQIFVSKKWIGKDKKIYGEKITTSPVCSGI